jgi:hypothetical protein
MQRILKMQQMSLLPKYIKLISGGFLFAFPCVIAGHLKVNALGHDAISPVLSLYSNFV